MRKKIVVAIVMILLIGGYFLSLNRNNVKNNKSLDKESIATETTKIIEGTEDLETIELSDLSEEKLETYYDIYNSK